MFFAKARFYLLQPHQVSTEKIIIIIFYGASNTPPCTGDATVHTHQPLPLHSCNHTSRWDTNNKCQQRPSYTYPIFNFFCCPCDLFSETFQYIYRIGIVYTICQESSKVTIDFNNIILDGSTHPSTCTSLLKDYFNCRGFPSINFSIHAIVLVSRELPVHGGNTHHNNHFLAWFHPRTRRHMFNLIYRWK